MSTFTLPTPANPGGALIPEEVELDFFGEDFLFTDDLQVTAYGDYALVSGNAALEQALRLRLIVCPGEHAAHPDFGVGLPNWVKKRATPADLDALRQLIIEQLGKEDRIDKVEEVTVERYDLADKTGIKIFIRVTALGRENAFAFKTFSE